MNIQHLNEIIRVLENVNPINFNIEEWVVTQAQLEQAKKIQPQPFRTQIPTTSRPKQLRNSLLRNGLGVSRSILYQKWFNTWRSSNTYTFVYGLQRATWESGRTNNSWFPSNQRLF